MATSARIRLRRPRVGAATAAPAAYAAGALLLAGEAAVHIQQYAGVIHAVRWIGPLFLGNAAACLAVIAGLAYAGTRRAAAAAGIAVSAVALGSLVVSYGQGLFGWQEAGFRTAVALAVIAEVGAAVLLAIALALAPTASPSS
jgi:hypothetical protein